jgi:DNA repair protein RecO (recombination protein O)
VASRNLVYSALSLRSRESPGGSRILTLMTAEAGLVDVFVFGGPKSKLRSLASPYASGRAFVYFDPVKDLYKLTDFETLESYPALREDLGRIWGAGLVAELLLRSSGGGGDFPLVLELALGCLRALDASEPGGSEKPVLVFLWRLVNLLGLGHDPEACSSCGREIRPIRTDEPIAAFSFALEGFLCPSCAAQADRSLPLGTGSIRWLSRVLELDFAEADRLVLLP